jgi:hypothetical protein
VIGVRRPSLLARIGRLSVADAALLAESVVLATAGELALRTLSFGRVVGAIGGLSTRPRPDCVGRLSAVEFAHLERLAGVPFRLSSSGGTCLRESLVLFVMLKRRRVPATLRIGVRRGCVLEAHAWVERDAAPSRGGTGADATHAVHANGSVPPGRAAAGAVRQAVRHGARADFAPLEASAAALDRRP